MLTYIYNINYNRTVIIRFYIIMNQCKCRVVFDCPSEAKNDHLWGKILGGFS